MLPIGNTRMISIRNFGKISDQFIRFDTTIEVLPVYIKFVFRRYRFVVFIDLFLKRLKRKKMAYVFVTGDVKVTAAITVEDSIKQILRWI